ncbi:MAG TPA: ribosome maturation factor RimM [Candidatus Aquilonibacter sp.]|nr:ribosome maturation factor RimM [Candidatus Aquilonibacter sp.]
MSALGIRRAWRIKETEPHINTPEISSEFITLARVMKAQGRHGEVASQIFSNIPDRFVVGMKLFALPQEPASPRRELEIEGIWPHKGLLVLKFVGIDSISAAETLAGCELQVPRNQRSQLQPGWNYVSDLVGCRVFDGDREIGRIEEIRFGAGEAPLLIVRDAAAKLLDVPFAKAYLDRVNLEQKQVRMKLPDGLLEVNAPLTADEKREQSQPGTSPPGKKKRRGWVL